MNIEQSLRDYAKNRRGEIAELCEDGADYINYLEGQIERLNKVIKMFEDKLRQGISEQEYVEFSKAVATIMFIDEVQASPSEDFKKFVAENWEKITGEQE